MKTSLVALVCGSGLLMSVWLVPAYAQKSKVKEKSQPKAKAKEGVEEKAPPRTDELKALDRFVGIWSTETTVRAAEWTPDARKMKGITRYEWIVGERFVQSRGRSSDGKFEESEILTYDPEAKQYQNWYFDSMGFTGDSVGQWDEKTQTMTWNGNLGDGGTLVNKVKFVNKDTQEWAILAKKKDGTLLLDMNGRLTREKAATARK